MDVEDLTKTGTFETDFSSNVRLGELTHTLSENEEPSENNDLEHRLSKAVFSLPKIHRQFFYSFYIEYDSWGEIAKLTKKSLRNAMKFMDEVTFYLQFLTDPELTLKDLDTLSRPENRHSHLKDSDFHYIYHVLSPEYEFVETFLEENDVLLQEMVGVQEEGKIEIANIGGRQFVRNPSAALDIIYETFPRDIQSESQDLAKKHVITSRADEELVAQIADEKIDEKGNDKESQIEAIDSFLENDVNIIDKLYDDLKPLYWSERDVMKMLKVDPFEVAKYRTTHKLIGTEIGDTWMFPKNEYNTFSLLLSWFIKIKSPERKRISKHDPTTLHQIYSRLTNKGIIQAYLTFQDHNTERAIFRRFNRSFHSMAQWMEKEYGDYLRLYTYAMEGFIDSIDELDFEKGNWQAWLFKRVRGYVLDQFRIEEPKFKRVSKTLRNKFEKWGNPSLPISLHTPAYRSNYKEEDKGVLLVDIITDPDQKIVGKITDAEYKEMLYDKMTSLLQQLSENERYVLNRYYIDEQIFREIAREMGFSESRISQIHTKAISRMKFLVKKSSAEEIERYIASPKIYSNEVPQYSEAETYKIMLDMFSDLKPGDRLTTVIEKMDRYNLNRKFMRALSSLPKHYQEVIEQLYFNNPKQTIEQIAEQRGVQIASVEDEYDVGYRAIHSLLIANLNRSQGSLLTYLKEKDLPPRLVNTLVKNLFKPANQHKHDNKSKPL